MSDQHQKICPFDKSHFVNPKKLLEHINKCRRNHGEYVKCEYSSTHYFLKDDIKKHEETCPQRLELEELIGSFRPTANAPKVDTCKNEGDWDEDSWDHYNSPTYDPQNYAMNANVLRIPPVNLTRAQRLQFNRDERARLSRIREQQNRERRQQE